MDCRWKDHKKIPCNKKLKKKLKKIWKKKNKSIIQHINVWKIRWKWERSKKLKDENLIYFFVMSVFLWFSMCKRPKNTGEKTSKKYCKKKIEKKIEKKGKKNKNKHQTVYKRIDYEKQMRKKWKSKRWNFYLFFGECVFFLIW